MFEARFSQASILKKLLDAIKDLVTDANFECSKAGISLQAMDSAHVALISVLIRRAGCEWYQCERNITLGINLNSMAKILKCAGNDDIVTMKADDDGDAVIFMFENPSQQKVSEFELKLLNIDSEALDIPDTEYKSIVKMPSSEFQRICRDLTILGDTVNIASTKEGVKFSVSGDLGNGSITCKPTSSADSKNEECTSIELQEPVQLTFALRYLNSFTKASGLSPSVSLCMSQEVPLVTEYRIDDVGYVRYFLAPKIEDDE